MGFFVFSRPHRTRLSPERAIAWARSGRAIPAQERRGTMRDMAKTRPKLIEELTVLRRRIAELEARGAGPGQAAAEEVDDFRSLDARPSGFIEDERGRLDVFCRICL